jgi:hypothetical protein
MKIKRQGTAAATNHNNHTNHILEKHYQKVTKEKPAREQQGIAPWDFDSRRMFLFDGSLGAQTHRRQSAVHSQNVFGKITRRNSTTGIKSFAHGTYSLETCSLREAYVETVPQA